MDVALLVVAIIICILVVFVNVYILIQYQHPDDRNQAWFPKLVVVIGLSLSELAVLMLPADVANSASCHFSYQNEACADTLPMLTLWYIVWISSAVFVFLVIPFAIFFYEGDEDRSVGRRIIGAFLWCLLFVCVAGTMLGLLYAYVGFVDLPVKRLISATVPITSNFGSLSVDAPCVSLYNVGLGACAAETAPVGSTSLWTLRVSFPQYVIALCTVAGSVLFSIFGGAGIATLPISCINSFIRRPRATISRSEYIKAAMAIANRAKDVRELALALRQEEKSGAKSWSWRRNVKKLQQELELLEGDELELQQKYPQGENPDVLWAWTVIAYIGTLVFGIFGLAISCAWVVHIILYMLIQPPASLFLNSFFITLNSWWGLLGTLAFAVFCFYLLLAVVSGEMYIGMNFIIFSVHPMKLNGTLMGSFLFNVGLIMACTISVLQFCSKAFATYSLATSVERIFGHSLESIRGIRYLYIFNIFQYIFIVAFLVAFVWFLAVERRRYKRRKAAKSHILK